MPFPEIFPLKISSLSFRLGVQFIEFFGSIAAIKIDSRYMTQKSIEL
jgi:hypothetical protein